MLRLVLFYASNKSHYLNKSSSLPLGKLCKKSGLAGKDVLCLCLYKGDNIDN